MVDEAQAGTSGVNQDSAVAGQRFLGDGTGENEVRALVGGGRGPEV